MKAEWSGSCPSLKTTIGDASMCGTPEGQEASRLRDELMPENPTMAQEREVEEIARAKLIEFPSEYGRTKTDGSMGIRVGCRIFIQGPIDRPGGVHTSDVGPRLSIARRSEDCRG